jgi:hypothetical protein
MLPIRGRAPCNDLREAECDDGGGLPRGHQALSPKGRASASAGIWAGLAGMAVAGGCTNEKRPAVAGWALEFMVELRGIEPLTSALRMQRSPS